MTDLKPCNREKYLNHPHYAVHYAGDTIIEGWEAKNSEFADGLREIRKALKEGRKSMRKTMYS